MRSWRDGGSRAASAKGLRRIALVVLIAAPSAVLGCGEDGTGGDGGLEPLEGRDCPPDSFLTYENFGEGFMRSWCTGCHSSYLGDGDRQDAPLGTDFDTREGIEAWRERIYARAGDANDTMPPAGGPPADDRILLADWLTCGMP